MLSEESENEDMYLTPQEQRIRNALQLDVEGTSAENLRPARDGSGNVQLHDKKQLDHEAKAQVLMYAALSMGYSPRKTKHENERIARAACTMVCYDLGYRQVYGTRSVEIWAAAINKSADVGGHRNVLVSQHKGKKGKMFIIDPTYLRQWYRRAMTALRHSATFDEIAKANDNCTSNRRI